MALQIEIRVTNSIIDYLFNKDIIMLVNEIILDSLLFYYFSLNLYYVFILN